MSLQIARLRRLTAPLQVGGRRHDHHGRRPDLPGNEARYGELAVTDADVDAILDEVGAAIGDEDLHGDVRVTPKELRKPRNDVQRTEARSDAHPHSAGRRHAAASDPGLGGVELGDQLRSGLEEIASRVGEHHASRGPHQELRPQVRFEGRDLLAHRRLADAQLARDCREAAALDNTDEHSHRVEAVHARVPSGFGGLTRATSSAAHVVPVHHRHRLLVEPELEQEIGFVQELASVQKLQVAAQCSLQCAGPQPENGLMQHISPLVQLPLT
jgi:hypothetical protein